MRAQATLVLMLLTLGTRPSWATGMSPTPNSPRAAVQADLPPQAIVTDGWAGIWDVHDETRDCTTGALVSTHAYLDTLCAGQAYYLTGPSYTQAGVAQPSPCNGPGFTDTALDLGCTMADSDLFQSYTRASWTRDADQTTTTTTLNVSYAAEFAGHNYCWKTTGTRTRIASGAATCATVPTRPQSWGALKLIYR